MSLGLIECNKVGHFNDFEMLISKREFLLKQCCT
jgi:hypothetical protein